MTTVLEISVASTGISWALRNATGPDAPVLDHDRVDVAADDSCAQQAAVRGALAIADASGHVVRSVSLKWSDDVEAAALTLRKWLLGLGFDNVAAAPPGKPARRRRPRFAPHLRAATIVAAGVFALFAVAPGLGGQPEAASAEYHPSTSASVIAVPVAPLGAAPSLLKVHTVPDMLPTSRPAPTVSGAATVAAVPVAAAEQTTVHQPPNPVVPAQDPMVDVLGSVLSALP